MKHIKLHLHSLADNLVGVMGSKKIFYAILALAVAQAAWYSLSFQPTIFDEGVHIGSIQAYSESWSPIIHDQNPKWDYLGEIAREGSYLYYYVMGYPYRLIDFFTDDYMVQVLVLRVINIGFFVGGLVVFRRVLLEATGDSKALVHSALLIFILTPAVALLPGAVNYDNLVFLLFSLLLLVAVKIVNDQKIDTTNVLVLVSLGLLVSVIKWTSIALIVPVFGYVLYLVTRRLLATPKLQWGDIWNHNINRRFYISVILLFVSLAVFIERPVYNYIEYGKPDPACEKVLTHERCLDFPGYAIYYEIDQNKPDSFRPVNPTQYFLEMWAPGMLLTQVSVLPPATLSVIKLVFYTLIPLGIVFSLIFIRDFLTRHSNQLLLFTAVLFSALLFFFLYRSYTVHGIPAAIRSRYLIPIMPIALYFILASYRRLVRANRVAMAISLLFVLALFTQGGGAITYLLTAPQNLYWPSAKETNQNLKERVSPLVKEKL